MAAATVAVWIPVLLSTHSIMCDEEVMGGWVSRALWGGDPDAPDAVSGLSRRDIYNVRKNWNTIYANPVANGSELLKRFFRAYPDAKKYFIFVAKIEEEEYESNAQFKAHVLNLMGALNAAVEHLHEPDVTVALMNKLGESHRRRFIKKQNFNDLKKVLVKMLVEVVMVDQASLQSWGRVVDFWFKHIFEALEAERDDADVNTR